MNIKSKIKNLEETNFLIKRIKNNLADFNFEILKLKINEEIFIFDLIYFSKEEKEIEFEVLNEELFEMISKIKIKNLSYQINNEDFVDIIKFSNITFKTIMTENYKSTKIFKIRVYYD